jgi:hypothetical protein
MHVGEEESIQDYGGKTRRKETTRRIIIIIIIIIIIMEWTDLAQDRYQWWVLGNKVINHLNSMALVRERNTRTERPPFVGEVRPTSAD